MSRSAKDATRFTATPPHAFSKPSPFRSPVDTTFTSTPSKSSLPKTDQIQNTTGTQLPSGSSGQTRTPPPATETAKEKVARLRAVRLAQRSKQLSPWERTVIRGRVWADRVHRFTALSLIGFTVIAAGVTTFALTDMILHNRRKRNAFYAEQHTIYANRLVAAIEMEKAGVPLDDDSLLILSRERAKVQAEERKKKTGIWMSVKGLLTGGLKKTMNDDEEVIAVPSEAEILGKIGVSSVGVLEAVEGKVKADVRGQVEGAEQGGLARTIESKKRELGFADQMGSTDIRTIAEERRGGMLDRLGKQTTVDTDIRPVSRGFLNRNASR